MYVYTPNADVLRENIILNGMRHKRKRKYIFFSFTACFSTSNTERWYEHNFHIERSCLRHSRCETRKFVYFLFFLCVLAPFTIRVRELKKHHPFSYVYVLDPASWAQRERELRVRIKICARPQLNAEKKTFFFTSTHRPQFSSI